MLISVVTVVLYVACWHVDWQGADCKNRQLPKNLILVRYSSVF